MKEEGLIEKPDFPPTFLPLYSESCLQCPAARRQAFQRWVCAEVSQLAQMTPRHGVGGAPEDLILKYKFASPKGKECVCVLDVG